MKQPFKETNKIRNQKPKDLPVDNKPPFDPQKVGHRN